MHEYYFANCRLLIDDAISEHKSMRYLVPFRSPLPYAHTFALRLGDPALLNEKYEAALAYPIVSETTGFEIRRGTNGWSFISKEYTAGGRRREREVLACSRNYGDMTLYMPEPGEGQRDYYLVFKTMVRVACNVGIAFCGGAVHSRLPCGKGRLRRSVRGPLGCGKINTGRAVGTVSRGGDRQWRRPHALRIGRRVVCRRYPVGSEGWQQ